MAVEIPPPDFPPAVTDHSGPESLLRFWGILGGTYVVLTGLFVAAHLAGMMLFSVLQLGLGRKAGIIREGGGSSVLLGRPMGGGEDDRCWTISRCGLLTWLWLCFPFYLTSVGRMVDNLRATKEWNRGRARDEARRETKRPRVTEMGVMV